MLLYIAQVICTRFVNIMMACVYMCVLINNFKTDVAQKTALSMATDKIHINAFPVKMI